VSLKKRNRELILDVVKKTDPDFEIKDNVYYVGSKAFVANSVVQWLLEKIDNGDMKKESAEFYIDSVNKYIAGEVNLRWVDDDLVIEGT
tara:strand:+ start:220 stop:486 length:267 start_codon:yes stop_codon:yes gene_type:complete